MARRTLGFLACGALSLLVACGGGTPDPVDGGDGGMDAAMDASMPDAADAATDGSADAADATTDAPMDAAPPDPPTIGISNPSVFDWGAQSCGTEIETRTLTVTNDGGSPLVYSVTLGGFFPEAFAIVSGGSGTVPPGGSADLVVRARLGEWAMGGGGYLAQLLFTSNASISGFSVGLHVQASGATIPAPAPLWFGEWALTGLGPRTYNMWLYNSGDVAASFTLGDPDDPQYTAPTGPFELTPGQYTEYFQIAYQPTRIGPAPARIPIHYTGVVCGTPPSHLDLVGSGASGDFRISRSEIEFGLTACGTTAPAETLTVTNAGAAAFTITSVTLAKAPASPFTISAPFTVVPAGDSVMITITPSAIPAAVATLPGDFGDELIITTDIVGDEPHVIPLRQGARGAILVAEPSAVDFGDGVPAGLSATQELDVLNVGNASATVTVTGAGSAFAVSGGTSFPLAPGATRNPTVTFSPESATTYSGTVTVTTLDALCQPLPPAVSLSGTGSGGAVHVSAQTVTFGSVSCGTTPAPRAVQVSNVGFGPATVTAELPTGSFFSVGRPNEAAAKTVSFVLAPSSSETLLVSAPTVPSTGSQPTYEDTLVVRTNLAGDSPRSLPITLQATGARPVLYGITEIIEAPTSGQATSYVWVDGGPLELYVASSNSKFSVPPIVSIPPGGTTVPVTFRPGTSLELEQTTLTFMTPSVLCAPLPPPTIVRGQGYGADVAIDRTRIDFGANTCNTPPPASTQLVVSNAGNVTVGFTATLLAGATNSAFQVTPSSGNVPANGVAFLSVSAKPVGSTQPRRVEELLQLVVGSKTFVVPIEQTISGAVLDFGGATALSFFPTLSESQSQARFRVHNRGNAGTLVGFSPGMSSIFEVGQSYIGPGQAYNFVGVFRPPQATSYTDSAQVYGASGLCSPLPASSITLQGTGVATNPSLYFSRYVDFGAVECGTTPGTTPLSIVNLGSSTLSWTASASAGFGVSPASGTLALGESAAIQVSRTAIPVALSTELDAFLYGGTVTITSGADTYVVPIDIRPQGAILTTSYPVDVPRGASRPASITNAGDRAVYIQFAPTTQSAANAIVNPTAGNAMPFSAFRFSVENVGDTNGTLNLVPSVMGPLCRPWVSPTINLQ